MPDRRAPKTTEGPGVEGLPARRAALRMLDAVLRRGQTLESAAGDVHGLADRDKGLALAIAGEALRRLPDFDALIDGATRQALPDDSKARMVLRIALAQKVGLGTPDHALVATALPLVDGGPRRLVHGILGTLLRAGLPPLEAPRLPDSVEVRWRTAWGEEAVVAARRLIARRPPLDLTFADAAEAEAYAEASGGMLLAPSSVRLDASSVIELEGFGAGRWWVQDVAASLPARLIPAGARDVLDLCAAPGGKTMQLAAAGHRVTGLDWAKSRLARLSENLARTRLQAELVAADALEWRPGRPYDAILLDAPCSATGTFRRHPEVLYRARPGVIAENAALQARLLARAAEWVKPGGTLVYAVCSLEPREGEEVIASFVDSRPEWGILAPEPGELPEFAPRDAGGQVRVLPGTLEAQGGCDGFFIARLVRSPA